MSRCVFGWPIRSDRTAFVSPTLAGGSWTTTLPLSNVQDRKLSKVARSTDATAASTQFTVDLGSSRPIRVLALILPNLTAAGTVRVRASSTAGVYTSPLYDSGTVTVRPAGWSNEDLGSIRPTFIAVTPTVVSAQHWLVEITDTGNSDGFVDVSRLVIAEGWQPSVNMSNGARLGLETATERLATDGPATVYNERSTRRTLEFVIQYIGDQESLQSAFDMQRIAGISHQLFFVFDPDDSLDFMYRRSFLCVLRSLTALDFAYYNMNSQPFQLIEEL